MACGRNVESVSPAQSAPSAGRHVERLLVEPVRCCSMISLGVGPVLVPLERLLAGENPTGQQSPSVKRSVTVSTLGGVTPCPACTLLHRLAISVVIARQTSPRKELQTRAKEVSESDWASEAVRQAVEAMMAGVAAFITAASSATVA